MSPPCSGCADCPNPNCPDPPGDPLANKLREVKEVLAEVNARVTGVVFGVSVFQMIDSIVEEFENTHLQLLREMQQHEADVEDMAEQLWISHELAVRGDAHYFPWVESFRKKQFRMMAERMLKQGFRRQKGDRD